MPNSELMPIGVFARPSGLTTSALRFYADSGLLHPAEVDPVSGYRYYSADQVARATALRQLREIAMPLTTVEAVLDAGADEASLLIDEHVAKVLGEAAAVQHLPAVSRPVRTGVGRAVAGGVWRPPHVEARGPPPAAGPGSGPRKAVVIKSSLADVPSLPIAVLKGPVLADAVEQVLTATAREPEVPVLSGLRMEATHDAITLSATDRYRLSTRTLVPVEPPTMTWAATVEGDELRAAGAEIRRSARVRVEATPQGVWLRVADRGDQHCRLLYKDFPDYRLMLASLGEVSTRVTVSKDQLLRAVEEHPGERIALHVTDHGVLHNARERAP